MKKLVDLYKKIFVAVSCMMLTMTFTNVNAQKESFSQKLSGFLKPGDSCVVIDDKYALLNDKEWGSIKHLKVEDIISFQLRFDTLAHIPHRPFKAELLVDVYYWKSDRQQEKPEEKKNISLRIEYDTIKGKAIKTKDFFSLTDAHKVAVVIRKIKGDYFKDSLPSFFQLKNEIFLKRKYPFDPAQPIKMFIAPKKNDNKVEVAAKGGVDTQSRLWETESGRECSMPASTYTISIPSTFTPPEEYDIEYCFVDYDSEAGETIRTAGGFPFMMVDFFKEQFRFNGTRVTIDQSVSTYDINLVYPQGYIFYRIRPVVYSGDIRDESNPWQYQDPFTTDFYAFEISEGASIAPHEVCLNWQYNASFAEDGKHKDVVAYFDGKLQTRQTVTLSTTHIGSSEDPLTAVVQESILDEFGRPTVNILPAPVDNDEIKYYRGFNISDASEKPYNYTDFVADEEDCTAFAQPLKVSSDPSNWGAAQYYSANNPFITQGSHRFVPDANGYPFTVTQFTPDQTGRIRNQGGVGTKFQIKKDTETEKYKYTKYFYGKPTQFQLDRLFGSEAGNSSHYLKNMVVDPNGQISVSYVNSTGKTIATSLVGLVTSNLDQLPSYYVPNYTEPTTPLTRLIKPSDFIFDGTTGELQATATFLAPVAGNYKLNSSLETLQYNVFHGSDLTSKLCYTCYYDIVVDVKNSCNVSLLSGGPYTIAAGASFQPNTYCITTPTPLLSGDLLATIDANNIGECFVTYTLKLSNKARENYTANHWESNTNLKKFEYFFEKLMSEASLEDCYSNCENCNELVEMGETKFVADLKNYIKKLITLKNDPNITYSETDAEAYLTSLYSSLTANCTANVLPACSTLNPCEQKLAIIKNDVSPGGQYALYNPDNLSPISDPTSIFAGSPAKYTQMPASWGSIIYPNPDNPLVSDVVIKEDGTTVQPEELTPEEFIRYFRPHWANTLALWHPEYCYYTWCTLNESSRMFDEKIKNMGADEAMTTSEPSSSTNYFVPISMYTTRNFLSLMENDPFFKNCGAGFPFIAAMTWELTNFSKTKLVTTTPPYINMNILEFIDHTIYCSDGSWDLKVAACTLDDECRKREKEWSLFVNFYLQLKQQYDEMARRCWMSTCVNCYIGSDGINRKDLTIDPSCGNPDNDWMKALPPLCEPRYNEGCTPSNPPNQIPYLKVEICNESLCNDHPSRNHYEFKTRIFPEYVSPCVIAALSCTEVKDGSQFTKNINDSIQKSFTENCIAAVENLIEELTKRNCISGWGEPEIQSLKDQLVANCKEGLLEINPIDPATGIIQLLHTNAVSSSSTNSFDNILASLGINVAGGCSSDLVGLPYPHDKQTYQLPQPSTDQVSEEICIRLNYFKDKYELAYGSMPHATELYSYMQSLLQEDFLLTFEQFEDLITTCGSKCNPRLLNSEILLPVALTKDNACKPCREIEDAASEFTAKYPSITSSDPQYEVLFKNFMNHYLGFSLSYIDYYNFLEQCKISGKPEVLLLCNKSGASQFLPEEYSCLKDKIDNAFSGAIYLLYQYKDSVDHAFRNAYTFACRNAKPSLTLKEPFQEYHFTLYYYDQAGNLVKTVPPQGVQPLSDVEASSVVHPWENTSLQPHLQVAGTETFTLGSTSLSDPFTIEMQLKKVSGTGEQVIFDATLNKQKAFNTSSLVEDFEKLLLKITTGGNFKLEHIYFTGSLGAVDLITDTYTFSSPSLPVGSWKHVALTYDGLGGYTLYIDAVPYLASKTTIPSSLPPDWDLVPLSNYVNLVFNANGTGSTLTMGYKEIRQYSRTLSANEIGFNKVLFDRPYSYINLDAYYKLNEGVAAGSTDLQNYTGNIYTTHINDAQWIDNTASDFTPTKHLFVTSYAYNSLNQVVKQHTPDGGTSQFWYDRLGRLVISQNEEQLSSSVGDENSRFSYTKYDALGRIIEVGEKIGLPELTDAQVRDNAVLQSWLTNDPSSVVYAAGIDKQITVTRYNDIANLTAPDGHTINEPSTTVIAQENLRNRVAATFYIEERGQPQQFATYYTYDISGNVKTLWQQLVPMYEYDLSGIKRMDYNYDLVSGKVNNVWYQQGKADQYYYHYKYDAENRLTEAWSGKSDGVYECKLDASYFYYLHGPLARMELGESESKLQGVDYAYTLQGWLKGVNSTLLNAEKDMGQDGYSGSSSHANFGRDVYNFGLNYYSNDYSAINAATIPFSNYHFSSKLDNPVGRELFNGNIASISLSLKKINDGLTAGYSYGYDQLNRLVNMRTHTPENLYPGLTWGRSDIETEKYAESYKYDANGNILKLKRNGPGTATSPINMDDLAYHYYYITIDERQREYYFNVSDKKYYDSETNIEIDLLNVKYFTNKLAHVNDDGSYTSLYTTDIDNQRDGHYTYDRIGNMIGDDENSKSIRWTVYGKIKSVEKVENDATVKKIQYQYDVSGNRVVKKVNNKITFYIRDAQGNTMAVYNGIDPNYIFDPAEIPAITDPTGYTWQEQHLYGSSRLGMFTPGIEIPRGTIDGSSSAELTGQRTYELSNHLGNVHVTIANILREVTTPENYFIPEILTTSDYYPFGMLMPERHGYKIDGGWASGTDNINGNSIPQQITADSRTDNTPAEYKASNFIEFVDGFVSGASDEFFAYIATAINTPGSASSSSTGAENRYRYGFNGKENDNEVKGEGNQQDYGMRIYDTRLGRFLSVDPLTEEYPELTPYQFASNTPIQAIDLDGLEMHHYTLTIDDQGEPILKHTKDEDFSEWQWKPGGTGVFSWWLWEKVKNPREEYVVTYKYRTYTVTEAVAFEHEAAASVTYNQDPTTLPINQVSNDIDKSLESNGVKQAFLQGLAGNLSTGLRSPTLPRKLVKASNTGSPSAATKNQTTRINGGNTNIAKVKNKNSNDAEGEFMLYDVHADGPKKGELLKIGKADEARKRADGTPDRMAVSQRLARKAGYPNATATPRKQLGTTTTRQATNAEAAEVIKERTNGNSLPLNKEKSKKYKG